MEKYKSNQRTLKVKNDHLTELMANTFIRNQPLLMQMLATNLSLSLLLPHIHPISRNSFNGSSFRFLVKKGKSSRAYPEYAELKEKHARRRTGRFAMGKAHC